MVRDLYPTMNTIDLAGKIGCSVKQLYMAAYYMGISKDRRRIEVMRSYAERFGVTMKDMEHYNLDQLDACADDSIRRLVIGVSEKFDVPLDLGTTPKGNYLFGSEPARAAMRTRRANRMFQLAGMSMRKPVRAEAGTVKARTA